MSGRYEITLTHNVYRFPETFSISNGTANGADLLAYFVYAGSVPSIYSDVSNSPGSWTVKP